ncbi:glucose 1-dehydrogenase [Pseudoalteromonas xiamenensis]|uniref:glucose 1-dehydrogenase n=1 Tax=Pseudoalteromonas xiamenensis TaxID=882626 RepID=UPI0035EBED69
MRLEGKVALVTGAARGIGEAISAKFVSEGAFVYVTDIDITQGKLLEQSLGNSSKFMFLDVRDEDCWISAMNQIQDLHGALDIVVNNAGITGFEEGASVHDPENVTLEEWRKVHETNLDGVFLGCKYAIRAMRAKGHGSIVNISSRSGIVGVASAAAYASSKAAVRNHTKTVALYCAEQNLDIRCNSIHPAAILTPMWEKFLGTGPERDSRAKFFLQDIPMKRFGEPIEVASLAVLLASDEAKYITGSELNIDGGILAGSILSNSD